MEHLTTANNTCFFDARNARKYGLIEHTWSDNGRIWLTSNEGSEPELERDFTTLHMEVNDAIATGEKPITEPRASRPARGRSAPLDNNKDSLTIADLFDLVKLAMEIINTNMVAGQEPIGINVHILVATTTGRTTSFHHSCLLRTLLPIIKTW